MQIVFGSTDGTGNVPFLVTTEKRGNVPMPFFKDAFRIGEIMYLDCQCVRRSATVWTFVEFHLHIVSPKIQTPYESTKTKTATLRGSAVAAVKKQIKMKTTYF